MENLPVNAGRLGWVLSPTQEDPTCCRVLPPCTPTIGPVLWSPGAAATEPAPWNLCSNTGEAPTMGGLLTAARD